MAGFDITCACGAKVAAVVIGDFLAGFWCATCVHAWDAQGQSLLAAA